MPDVLTTLRSPNYASAPGSPKTGQLYYDTITNILYFWNGAAWRPVDVPTLIYKNQSVAAQATQFATDTYLAGSLITVPVGGWTVGAQYWCQWDMAKTANGVVAFQLNVRIGTLGSTGDTAVYNLTSPAAQTAVADQAWFEVLLNVRTIGASATIIGMTRMTRGTITAAGLYAIATPILVTAGTATTTFNSTTATKIGVSFNGGTSFNGTTQLVQSELRL